MPSIGTGMQNQLPVAMLHLYTEITHRVAACKLNKIFDGNLKRELFDNALLQLLI